MEMRRNKIKSLSGLANIPNLKELYLAENEIRSFEGLKNMQNL